MAYEMLDGFGDANAQWTEDRPRVFHLRRRLTKAEQAMIGEAVDCRNTTEAQHRYDAIKDVLPRTTLLMVKEEVPGIRL